MNKPSNRGSSARRSRGNEGFTLLELAVVLAIMATMIGGSIVFTLAILKNIQLKTTNERMDLIQQTLLDYIYEYGALPCPADLTESPDEPSFGFGQSGQNAVIGGDCMNANFAKDEGTLHTVAGAVPVRALGLPDEMLMDGFGMRFMYVIPDNLIIFRLFSIMPLDSPLGGSITVKDDMGNVRTSKASYLLLSHGANGHGAYPYGGGLVRRSVGSKNAQELENCDCNKDGVSGAFNHTFVQKMVSKALGDDTNQFDDLVRYIVRSDLPDFGQSSR